MAIEMRHQTTAARLRAVAELRGSTAAPLERVAALTAVDLLMGRLGRPTVVDTHGLRDAVPMTRAASHNLTPTFAPAGCVTEDEGGGHSGR